jgi:hypothetical protein
MPLETGLPDNIVAALKRGNKIEAIKLLREQTGIGLKEAKDAIEASGIEPDNAPSPGEVRGGAGMVRWLVVLAVVALACYFLFR